jgi:hypothetical protein
VNLLLALLFGAIAYSYYKKVVALRKYEFENRTDGGVVKFESFEASRKHDRQLIGCTNMTPIFGLLAILSLMLPF